MSKSKGFMKPDERIEKETNRFSGKLFYVLCALLIVSLVVKCCFDLPFYVYALEIIGLAAGVVCFLVQEMRSGILFVTKKDEALSELHSKALSKAMLVQFYVLVIVGCIQVLVSDFYEPFQQYEWWFYSYMLVILPVSLIITIVTVKKGWYVWGGKNREKSGKKNLAVRTVFASLLFGILMEIGEGFKHVYREGVFHAEGILWIVAIGALWGIMFYFVMLAMIKASEKRADKHLKEVGIETDEQGGTAYEE